MNSRAPSALLKAVAVACLLGACSPSADPPPRVPGDARVRAPAGMDAEAPIRALLHRWRSLSPDAPLPDVELVLETEDRNGTPTVADARFDPDEATGGRIVVALSRGEPQAPLDEALAPLAVELVRVAQRGHAVRSFPFSLLPDRPTLLDRAIREGAADLLAHVITGRPPNPELLEWGRSREARLWEAFQEVEDRRDVPAWYEPALDEDAPPPPGDPLRFVGYRIVEGLWSRSPDRVGMVDQLIQLDDPEELAGRSIYAGRGPGPAAPPTTAGLPIAPWPGFECHHVRVGDATLFGCVGGSGGAPVVLQGADGADHRSWHRVAPLLARHTRVVVYDPVVAQSTPEDEPAPPPHQAIHELAGLLEILVGPGPYVLAGAGPGAQRAQLFASLYPWRTGGMLLMGIGGAGTAAAPLDRPMPRIEIRRTENGEAHLDQPARTASLLGEMAEQVRAMGPDALPGQIGEPRGCMTTDVPGSSELNGRVVRLTMTPRGAEDRLPGSHPILDLGRGPSERLGTWHPLGRDRLRLQIESGSVPMPQGELSRTGDEGWLGSLTAGPGGGEVSFALTPHPCERPD